MQIGDTIKYKDLIFKDDKPYHEVVECTIVNVNRDDRGRGERVFYDIKWKGGEAFSVSDKDFTNKEVGVYKIKQN